jgi:GTP-binding protein EngB required for normal cell division
MSWEAATERLRALAQAAEAPDLAVEAGILAERLGEQRFHVACVGQFKRGKSTLVNALVGEPILPTGVVPVTTVPTVLRHGLPGARVRFAHGWVSISPSAIAEYATEQLNPGNRKAVLAIEVSLPAPILEQGLCLVDTPGLGSVFEASSEATRGFVPHLDAALVVLGADPPISGEELRLVGDILAQVDTVLFLLNKADRVSEAERVEAAAFIRRVVRERLGVEVERLYQVSALGGGGGPDWPSLVERLRTLGAAGRDRLVRGAAQRGLSRLGHALILRLEERVGALTQPVAESRRRVEELGRLSASADQALRDLSPLFAAEEARLVRLFEEWAQRFLTESEPAGRARLRAAWGEGRLDQVPREAMLEAVNRIARDLVQAWLVRSEVEAESAFRDAVRRFSQIANDHLDRLTRAQGLDARRPPAIAPHAEQLRVGRHFVFSDRIRYHYPRTLLPRLGELLLPRSWRRRRRQRAAERYLMDLLAVNASRVTGDLAERVRESRGAVEGEIRQALEGLSRAAREALAWASTVQARGAEAAAREADRLRALISEVEVVLDPVRDRAA